MTMLQFSTALYAATTRLMPRTSWRVTAFVAGNYSTSTSELSTVSVKEDNNAEIKLEVQDVSPKKKNQKTKKTEAQTKFYSSGNKWMSEDDITFSKKVKTAESVNDLLDLATSNLSVKNALKLISNITNRINSGKSQIVDIEVDERFIHLRKLVKGGDKMKTETSASNNNFSQYRKLSTPAMIEVMAHLREQGDRNTPLLRMLSCNIVKYNTRLNLKQCAALLYSMAVLSFPDEALLEKITSELLKSISQSTNAVTNKSIITSLGFLRYRNEDVLDAFCDTLFTVNYTFLDYASILQTFAALQYKSEKAMSFIEKFAEQMDPFQISPIEWLDMVWSLAVLDTVRPRHVELVFDVFTEKLNSSSTLSVSKKLKLLNINAVAQFILKDYKGLLLGKDLQVFNNLSLIRAKEKQMYIDALSETLIKLLPSSSYFKTNIDTNMGFLLDAEYRVNDQNELIKVEDWTEEQSENVKRMAIMVHDYHDYCRGQNNLIGSVYLYTQLLKAKGYKLVTISYENFSIQDKIEKRIIYLKHCMNSVQEMKFV